MQARVIGSEQSMERWPPGIAMLTACVDLFG